MHGFDLLCLPSLVPESFSLVVHEAAAAGVPALVSDLGAPAEAIARSGAGAVVPAGAVAAWTQALHDWATQPERQAAWRRAVRLPMRIEEEAFLYESLYRSALSAG
jgi:glycosyltransferase involved in cell wall biosynthesis